MNLKIVLFLLTASFPIIDACINYFYDKSEVTTTLSKKQLNELNPPNILFIIADDMGKDATAGFSEGTIKPSTPNLNSIKDTGLKFNNFWTYPTCSPTRASIITGKYGYRTGIKWAGDVMDNSEKILQQFIKEQTNNTYATGLIGKWHLSGESSNVNPETLGIDYYAGLSRGAAQNYYRWQLTEDGVGSLQTEYITKVFTDLSIDWINRQDKPWFLWLAYNAPHTPFHIPPAATHSQGALPDYEDNLDATPYYMAAIESMDYQIGRLLENIPADELDNTIIIFIGDNGTPSEVAQLPYTRTSSKGSLYQGGVNVPMFITGNGVNRMGEDNSIIGSTDLFSTIAELAGVNNKEIYDSKSFKHLLDNSAAHRDFQYAEKDYADNDLWSINNGEYKLIVNANGGEEMYDLPNDPYEANNLLNGNLTTIQEAAKVALETELAIIRNQCQYEINLNEIIIASETLSAIKNISFAGSISSSSVTVFEAGDSIILKSGFSTGAGATFTAKIQDCVPSDNSVKIIPQYPLSNIRTNIAPSIQNPFNLVISPNPSFGNSKILFELTQDSPISINLFDQFGKLSSALLSSSNRSAGKHELLIDEELNDGLYYVVMQTPFERVTKKMIVIK